MWIPGVTWFFKRTQKTSFSECDFDSRAHTFSSPRTLMHTRGATFARRICIIAHTLAVTIAHSRDNCIAYSYTALVTQFRVIVVAIAAIFFPEYRRGFSATAKLASPPLAFLPFVFFPANFHYCAFIGSDPLCFVSFSNYVLTTGKIKSIVVESFRVSFIYSTIF